MMGAAASVVLAVAALALHLALMLLAAPLAMGVLRHVRARLLGQAGPPVAQPWRDLRRLLRKQPVVDEGASWLFVAAPGAELAVLLAAAALVPSFALGMATAPFADLVLLAGLLALARVLPVLAGLDGGGQAALGASRRLARTMPTEATLLLAVMALALLGGTGNLDAAVRALQGGVGRPLAAGLALAALVAVALVDCGRGPVAAPPAPAHSGRLRALADWAEALRLLLFLSLIAALAVPAGIARAGQLPLWWLVGLVAWAAKIGVLVVVLAVAERSLGRLRAARLPALLGGAGLLALLALVLQALALRAGGYGGW